MSRSRVSESVRQRVRETARFRCGYCLTQENVVSYPLHIEHLLPEAKGGKSDEENLWLSCSVCNNFKGTQTHAENPETGESLALFNPHTQNWSEHFAWNEGGTHVVGLTLMGRATVNALKLNAPFRIISRQRWVSVGWHPPKD
jgi:hypothetical protein